MGGCSRADRVPPCHTTAPRTAAPHLAPSLRWRLSRFNCARAARRADLLARYVPSSGSVAAASGTPAGPIPLMRFRVVLGSASSVLAAIALPQVLVEPGPVC